jgi:hypothetical protein
MNWVLVALAFLYAATLAGLLPTAQMLLAFASDPRIGNAVVIDFFSQVPKPRTTYSQMRPSQK